MDYEGKAKRLLIHYLRRLVRETGNQWDSDNDAEVEEIVECIIEAAVEKMEAAAAK